MFHTVPLFDLQLVWVGAYGCILDLICFATTFGLVTGAVCNTRLSHYLGVDHSMVTMLKTLFCFVLARGRMLI